MSTAADRNAKIVTRQEVLNTAAAELELRADNADNTVAKHTAMSGEQTYHFLRGVAAGLRIAAARLRTGRP